MMLGLLIGVIVLAIAWTWLLGLALAQAKAELRAARLELVSATVRAADEQTGKEAALKLLDEITQLRASDLQTLTARLDALQHQYDVVKQLYQDSLAIDGPLGSPRLQ